jgi:hypothetical protein
VDQLIMSMTRPDGTMDVVLPAVPQVGEVDYANFVLAFPGHTHHIANCGHPVPLRVAMNIKLIVLWIKHQRHISLVPDMAVLTVPTVYACRNQMTCEGGHTVTMTQPVINDKDKLKTWEYLSEYLVAKLSEQCNPLSYVICTQVEVPPKAGNPSTGYGTVDLDMIVRGTHTGFAYQMDNIKVWEIMSNICSEHVCYIYIKGAVRVNNGRDMFQRFFDLYLGPVNINKMASAAGFKLNATQ